MRRRPTLLYRQDDPAAGGGEPTTEPSAPAAPAAGSEPQEPAAGDGQVTMTKAEVEALQRQAREGREAKKQADRERQEAEERRAQEQGQWEQLAKQREQERDAALARAERVQREANVTRLASSRFHDPSDVLHRLGDEELADEASIRTGLDRVAREAPHLLRPTGSEPTPEIGQVKAPAGVTPAEGPTPAGQELTWEDVKAMTEEQFAELDDEGWERVNKVLAAGPPS